MEQALVEQAAPDVAGVTDGSPRAGRRRRLSPRTRRGRIVAATALVLVLGVAVWFMFFRPQPAASTTTTRQTVTIATTTLTSTVSATGTLKPERQADLTFSSAGTVTSVAVAIGDAVTSGQTLATIDPTALKIAHQSASADLTAAQETLADLKASSSSTTASVNAAAATVQVKQNALATAKANLAAATMTAPFDGVVAEVNIAAGDTTGSSSGGAAGGTSTSSSAAIVLISQGTFTVSTSVSNSDVSSIKRGLQAVITPTGATTPVYGTVTSVGVVASSSSSSSGSSSGSTTFPVTIHVTGAHTDLLPGSSVSVGIVTAQYADVIAVPTQALTTTNGATTVAKVVNGQEVATTVKTGQTVGSSTIITEGLVEGDQIVMTGVRVATGNASANASSRAGSRGMGSDPMAGGLPPGSGGQPPQGQPAAGANR